MSPSARRGRAYSGPGRPANYLALDRSDIACACAANELCRRMVASRESDIGCLKHVARYLLGAPRHSYWFGMHTPRQHRRIRSY